MENHVILDCQSTENVLASLPDGLLVFSEDQVLYANGNACHILGFDVTALLNTPLSKLVDRRDYFCLLDRVADVLKHKPVNPFDVSIQSQKGDVVHIEFNLSRINWHGKTCMLASLREHGQRRRMSVAIQSLAEFDISRPLQEFHELCVSRLADVYDARYAFIALLNPHKEDSVITTAVWNSGEIAENFEYGLQGTPCADILTGKKELISRDAARLYPDDRMLVDMQVESYFGAPLITAEGTTIGLIAVLDSKPMYVDHVAATTLGVFAHRITAELSRQQARNTIIDLNNSLENMVQERTQQLQESEREARRANQAKTDFLTKMSHELRTPLNAILGFGQLLQADERVKSEQQDWVNEMVSAGYHLLDIINEILDIARIESGHMVLDMEPIQLGSVMQESVSAVKTMADERGIEFVLEQSEGHKTCYVLAERTRLKQVLLNLLSNAIKYNRENGRVNISCQNVNQEHIRITIEDTGEGMTEAQLDSVFEPFVRFGAESSGIPGTGIGMTITRHLVTLMGGRINIQSKLGEGTRVMIDLPLREKLNVKQNQVF